MNRLNLYTVANLHSYLKILLNMIEIHNIILIIIKITGVTHIRDAGDTSPPVFSIGQFCFHPFSVHTWFKCSAKYLVPRSVG